METTDEAEFTQVWSRSGYRFWPGGRCTGFSARSGSHYRQQGYVNQDGYTSDNIYQVENLAYYGDWDSNRVFVIDVDSMALLTTVEGTGDGRYGIDSAASHDGVFFRIDQETLDVSDRLYLGGNILMGSFIWNGDGVNM